MTILRTLMVVFSVMLLVEVGRASVVIFGNVPNSESMVIDIATIYNAENKGADAWHPEDTFDGLCLGIQNIKTKVSSGFCIQKVEIEKRAMTIPQLMMLLMKDNVRMSCTTRPTDMHIFCENLHFGVELRSLDKAN